MRLAWLQRWFALSCLWLGMAAALPAQAVAAEAQSHPQGEQRPLVFAHYMVCYFSSVDFYKQEIELAQRNGIDGFALNCGSWASGEAKNGYVEAAERMHEAARQLNTGFKLFFSPDVNGLGNMTVNAADMVKRFYNHPNQMRHNGKPVLSCWLGPPQLYKGAIESLKKEGIEVCFLPYPSTRRFTMAWSMESALRFFDGHEYVDGLFNFAADASMQDHLNTNANGRRATQYLGKVFMAGVAPTYNSANMRDYRGMEGYGELWKGIIRDKADYVEIVTWNDYNEDSNLMPFQWPMNSTKTQISRDESFLDVTAYYSAWYKSGVEPKITQDKLYYTYRNRSKWLRQAWDVKEQKWVDLTATPWPFDQIHDDVHDNVYVSTFLTAPAELTVELGGQTKTVEMPAGVSHLAVPMTPGTPRFILRRTAQGKSETLVDVVGRRQIIAEATKENSPYSPNEKHRLNRNWTGAAVAGPAQRIEAESGKLNENTSVAAVAAAQTVTTTDQPGSGFTVPVSGLQRATYNIRIVYSNPSADEARLTLHANGAPREPNDRVPYSIPVWFPPTGEGKLATVSFLWSLYDTTSQLKIEHELGSYFGQARPEWDDYGSVSIDAIELVKVAPVEVSPPKNLRRPEMVSIPGGTFTMGSTEGDRDERPAHQVTLAPFAIGKYEITNAQYEQFDPEHRSYRDGFSWRDDEPVVQVSWNNAAEYCNWLSEQNGLAPVYDLKTGEANLAADGFRLPTEAQWEYVATGRGEDRKYPWGNEAPTDEHGQFQLERALSADSRLPSTAEQGTVVVGSYPRGASRDGVMDLAGNVSEWCGDWFAPYTAEAKTDPLATTSPNMRLRAIRGGSWGYYGYSQRTRDREYNNPQYPGYVYIGFRVALPEASLKKLAP